MYKMKRKQMVTGLNRLMIGKKKEKNEIELKGTVDHSSMI